MKKNDFILIGILLLVTLASYLCFSFYTKQGDEVVVTVDGVLYGTYNLTENQVIDIGEGNTLTIHDGEAYMTYADCPDGLCMNQGSIHKSMESIICLPNKVVVEIISKEEAEFDIIS